MEKKQNTYSFKKTPIELFEEWANTGKDEGMERGHNESVNFMIKKIKEKKIKGKQGIDIGCGNGWSVRKMKKELLYKDIIGIDGSQTMIKKAKKKDEKGKYICKNIKTYKPKQKYDLIHSMEVLYYLKKPEKFIKRVYDKWQEKGGFFILGIDHYLENKPSKSWPEECGVFMNTKPKKEWKLILKQSGYKNVKMWQVNAKEEWKGTLIIMGEKK